MILKIKRALELGKRSDAILLRGESLRHCYENVPGDQLVVVDS